MNEDLLKKTRKYTTPQLLVKVEKAKGDEKAAIIQILSDRGQDVSCWTPEAPAVEKIPAIEFDFKAVIDAKMPVVDIEEIRQSVDDYLDSLVLSNNAKQYGLAVIALGGDEDSDIAELLSTTDIDGLNAVLALKNGDTTVPTAKVKAGKTPKVKAPKPPKTPKEPKVKKEKTAKQAKTLKSEPDPGSKSAEILELLKVGKLSKYAIAKELGTRYQIVAYVEKRYLLGPQAEEPVTAPEVSGSAE